MQRSLWIALVLLLATVVLAAWLWLNLHGHVAYTLLVWKHAELQALHSFTSTYDGVDRQVVSIRPDQMTLAQVGRLFNIVGGSISVPACVLLLALATAAYFFAPSRRFRTPLDADGVFRAQGEPFRCAGAYVGREQPLVEPKPGMLRANDFALHAPEWIARHAWHPKAEFQPSLCRLALARQLGPVWTGTAAAQPPAPSGGAPDGSTGGATVSFAMLLNLAAVANSEDPAVLWAFLQRYAPGVTPATHPRLDQLVGYAVRYFRDFVRPAKRYRAPDEVERGALDSLARMLGDLPPGATAEDIQTALYDIARPIPRYQDFKAKTATPERPGVSNDWFNMLYQVLLGEERGPRFGSFVALYGIPETRALIAKALAGNLMREHEVFLADLGPRSPVQL